MTVSVTSDRRTFACDGTTQVFSCNFRVLEATEMVVYLVTVATGASSALSYGVDYTVSSVGEPTTVVTMATAYSSAHQLKFRRVTQRLQLVDYLDNDPFPAETHERALDRLTHIVQEIDSNVGRAVLVPEPETGATLDAASVRAGRLLGFNATTGAPESTAFTQAQMAAVLSAEASSGVAGGNVLATESQTVAAGTTVVTLASVTYTPGTSSILVWADGAFLTPGVDFTETGSDEITLAAAFGTDVDLAVVVGRLVTSAIEAAMVSFLAPSGVGRSLNARALEHLSVTDFGADPTGVTDSTTAIQTAINTLYGLGGGELYVPAGRYKTSAAISLRRHVSLVGPVHRIPTASTYGVVYDLEATITGMAQIIPTANLTGRAIIWDFQLADELERPYGASLHNILVDLDACTGTVDGVYCRALPAGEGVFDNGWTGGAAWMYGCVVMNAPRYGVFIESTDNEKVNLKIENSRVAFSGSHGINAYKCFDVSIRDSFSYANGENGLNMYGCATERVYHNDIFNNLGHGIVMDGSNAFYGFNEVQNNHKHGIYVRADGTTQTDKRYRVMGGRVSTNSYGYDNTYDNIHIEDRSGTALAQIFLMAVSIGETAHSGTSNRVRAEVYSTALPTQSPNVMSNCIVPSLDLKSGNEAFNTNVWESFVFDNSLDAGGQILGQQFRTLTPWTGSTSPNVLRGVTKFRTANTGGATLGGFSAGPSRLEGREVWVLIDDANTAVDFTSSTLKGNGGVDLASGTSQGKLIHFINYDGTNWAATIYG